MGPDGRRSGSDRHGARQQDSFRAISRPGDYCLWHFRHSDHNLPNPEYTPPGWRYWNVRLVLVHDRGKLAVVFVENLPKNDKSPRSGPATSHGWGFALARDDRLSGGGLAEVAGDEFFELAGAERPREVEALAHLAAEHLELGDLVNRLHPFGDRRYAHGGGQVDDRADDGRVHPAFANPLDERPVDLDLVRGEVLQVGQRGMTGAEVIDGQAHAELAELAHDLAGTRDVVHDHGLGDLEYEQLGWDSGGVQSRGDL